MELPPTEPSATVPSVSQLTDQIKQMLEPRFSDILVEGELSNISRSRNGHYYFTVKDSRAQMPCVVWSRTADRLDIQLQDGQQVILGGSVQVYAPYGKYQLIVSSVQQAGIGRLQQAFEELKKKLKAEGLFDPKQKKSLPPFPRRIGVITSAAGAAFHDIVSTLERRWPMATIYLYHASVQGTRAAAELTAGLRYFSREPSTDLLIIGRGGGSLEDLWPFNEESVARAIHDSPIPVISAVGHEVDFSISDFTADIRAATPTQAALLATPDITDTKFQVDDHANKLVGLLNEKLYRARQQLTRLGQSHALLVVRQKIQNRNGWLQHLEDNLQTALVRAIPSRREQISQLGNRLSHQMNRLIPKKREQFLDLRHRLETRNPNRPLDMGYVRVWQQGKWIRKPDGLNPENPLELEWKEARTELAKGQG
ncbi:MAG: exodeoxyribonuclease VII large subunit [Balneolaceae bacterium]